MMKRILLVCGLALISISDQANANDVGLLGVTTDFAAPIVRNSDSIKNDVSFGTIVYDNTTSSFQGMDVHGDWVKLGVAPSLTKSEIVVTTPSGHGSTATYIRYFTVVEKQSGTAISVTSNSTDGTKFTINEAGTYFVSYCNDLRAAVSGTAVGISVNAASLTLPPSGADLVAEITTASNTSGCAVGTLNLALNDVVRPHSGSSNKADSTDSRVKFRIVKLAD